MNVTAYAHILQIKPSGPNGDVTIDFSWHKCSMVNSNVDQCASNTGVGITSEAVLEGFKSDMINRIEASAMEIHGDDITVVNLILL